MKGFQKSQSQNENSQHDNKYCNDSGKKVNYGQIIFKFLRHVFVVDEDDNTLEYNDNDLKNLHYSYYIFKFISYLLLLF